MTEFAAGKRSALLVRGLLAVALLVLVSWQVLARTYELEGGSFGGGGTDSRPFQQPHRSGILYRFEVGRTYDLYFSVRNPGPVPVRVEEVGDNGQLLVDRLAILPGTPAGCCDQAGAAPFQPVDLAPGQELLILATLRLHQFSDSQADWPCSSRRWWWTMPVRFSVLGTARSSEVLLPETFFIEAPGCHAST
ncbi:hypothetical protein [Catellatospora chokoriensis]|uniref:Uncharacterized protein n=1 Tax=Catellatospora chokoriensis TaxID=310353 RepID=A0A8J3NQE8_9ACTN|nr:hypothetical protein [Catellatospora chokoriensis]GIF86945.1 hypothetical protein Cch02nite_03890 [Catellatospora chokoriensis]